LEEKQMDGNTLFDGLDASLVQRLSERPEALADEQFLKASAASAYAASDGVNSFNRTPINEELPPPIIFALNLALLAESLETEFYSTGLNTPGLIPNELRPVFVRILLNEVLHRETFLTLLGRYAISKPAFDLTAGGALPDVLTNFNTFIGLGQTFEDNGVRAIKGQAPNVQSNKFILTTALRFHSAEGRHASELRRIRGQKGWITLNDRGNLPPIAQGVYNGEARVRQGGINLVVLTGFSRETVSEAFDEPLTGRRVLRNIRPFIKHGFIFPLNNGRDAEDTDTES